MQVTNVDRMKVAHLISDEKFPDAAFLHFERINPGNNIFYLPVRSEKYKSKYLNLLTPKIVLKKNVNDKSFISELEGYDAVIFHSLSPFNVKIAKNLQKKEVPTLWIGMGYDYYDLIFQSPLSLLEPITRKKIGYISYFNDNSSIRSVMKFIFRLIGGYKLRIKSKLKAINTIDFFAPVCKEEYSLLQEKLEGKVENFPDFISWSYSTSILNNNENRSSLCQSGNNILLGNSAALTNNHLDLLELLSSLNIERGRKVICPLSYGSHRVKKSVTKKGKELFGDDFIAINEFMPFNEYSALIMSCSHIVMGHKRQQGAGNIAQGLASGARVIMNDESVLLLRYRRLGFIVHSLTELKENPALIVQAATVEEKRINYEICIERRSDQNTKNKTQKVLESLAGLGICRKKNSCR